MIINAIIVIIASCKFIRVYLPRFFGVKNCISPVVERVLIDELAEQTPEVVIL